MKNLVIAKRYAKALFSIALSDGAVEQYGQALVDFAAVLRQYPDIGDALGNPFYPEDARKKVFEGIAAKLEMGAIVKQFIHLLIEKGRVGNLGEISDYYRRLMDEHRKIARAQVTAAVKLDDEALDAIAQSLGKMTGKQVVIEFERDPELIGGVVARIGDLVIDGSVRSQLNNMKEFLKRGELG